jgi:hypothetical protein
MSATAGSQQKKGRQQEKGHSNNRNPFSNNMGREKENASNSRKSGTQVGVPTAVRTLAAAWKISAVKITVMMSTAGRCLQEQGISNGTDNSNSSDVSNSRTVAHELSHQFIKK